MSQSSNPNTTSEPTSNNLVVMAIVYDFDGTLGPGDMQDQFIREVGQKLGPKLHIEPEDYTCHFWKEVKKLSKEQQADEILIYLYHMLDQAKEAKVPVRRSDFKARGKHVKLFNGVKEWFLRVNTYGSRLGVKIEHYIVSSGNTEILEGTPIAEEFERIYACKFLFDKQCNAATKPIQAVNFTTKTQFLFRINKGVHELSETEQLNKYVPLEERKVPFANMIYIGDTDKDIPCMRLVKDLGGLSVAVYDPDGDNSKAIQLYEDGRVHGVAPADYTAESDLDQMIQSQIRRVASQAVISNLTRSRLSATARH